MSAHTRRIAAYAIVVVAFIIVAGVLNAQIDELSQSNARLCAASKILANGAFAPFPVTANLSPEIAAARQESNNLKAVRRDQALRKLAPLGCPTPALGSSGP